MFVFIFISTFYHKSQTLRSLRFIFSLKKAVVLFFSATAPFLYVNLITKEIILGNTKNVFEVYFIRLYNFLFLIFNQIGFRCSNADDKRVEENIKFFLKKIEINFDFPWPLYYYIGKERNKNKIN